MLWNVPPPPRVTQMLGYCAPQRPRRAAGPGRSAPNSVALTAGGKNVPANPWIWMSSRSESLPAIHSTPTARGLIAPVKMPSPLTMFVPPCGASSSAFGGPDAVEALRPIRQIELRRVRVQRDQHGVRLQPDGVADDVEAGREVEDAVRVDGRLERARCRRPVRRPSRRASAR